MDDDYVFEYSRQDAIDDGVLTDVSREARQLGFTVPVAITRTVLWEWIVPEETSDGQSITGRLWDVLNVLRWTITTTESDTDTVIFPVIFREEGHDVEVMLKSVIGPGDTPDPVLTIMLPEED